MTKKLTNNPYIFNPEDASKAYREPTDYTKFLKKEGNKMPKLSEADIAEKVLTLMFENEEVEDYITALNQAAPEVKAWLIKVLPHEEK